MTPLLAALPVEEPVDPNRYVDPSVVGPGFIGFVLFIGLGLATVFLWRSMNKQLRRIDIPEDPDDAAVRPVNAPFSRNDVSDAAPSAPPRSAAAPPQPSKGSGSTS